jgi:hypothetical protein
MSILDKLFGHEEQPQRQQAPQQPYYPPQQQQAPPAQSADQQAIARYQYMLRTAPPETIEQAHQEAFAQLSPEQRRQVLQQLTNAVPLSERPPASAADDPQALARAATRAEVRQPGTLERLFGSTGAPGAAGATGGGMGFGGTLLTGLAGAFVGTAIADHFFRGPMGSGFMGGGGSGGGYGGGTVVNETVNNYGSDSDDDNSNDDSDKNDSDDDSGNASNDDSSFDDSDSGGSVDV